MTITTERKERLLETATQACFFTGVEDLADRLTRANAPYGVARIRAAQEELGLRPDATFVSAPDATITRNIERFEAGFGYGGRLRWSGDFVVLDVKTNGCGLYLGRVADVPTASEVLERMAALRGAGNWQADTGTSWDFGTSNHFIHVLRFDQPVAGDRYGILCHGSGPELRGPGRHGPGLYYSHSPRLRELAEEVPTPWGPLHIIREAAAVQEYWQGYLAAEELSKARRRSLVEALFPGTREVSNLTHQGALGPADCYLGSVAEPAAELVPVALRADLPVTLLALEPNLAPAIAERLGFVERARTLGVLDHVLEANILPHGGGYTIPGYADLERIVERPEGRVFEMRIEAGRPAKAFHRHFRHVPFDYRGEEVIRRVEELRMGRVVNRAEPLYEFMV